MKYLSFDYIYAHHKARIPHQHLAIIALPSSKYVAIGISLGWEFHGNNKNPPPIRRLCKFCLYNNHKWRIIFSMWNILIFPIIVFICFWFGCWCFAENYFKISQRMNGKLKQHSQQATKSMCKLFHQRQTEWMGEWKVDSSNNQTSKHTVFMHDGKLNFLGAEAKMLEKAFNWRQLNNTFNTHWD